MCVYNDGVCCDCLCWCCGWRWWSVRVRVSVGGCLFLCLFCNGCKMGLGGGFTCSSLPLYYHWLTYFHSAEITVLLLHRLCVCVSNVVFLCTSTHFPCVMCNTSIITRVALLSCGLFFFLCFFPVGLQCSIYFSGDLLQDKLSHIVNITRFLLRFLCFIWTLSFPKTVSVE